MLIITCYKLRNLHKHLFFLFLWSQLEGSYQTLIILQNLFFCYFFIFIDLYRLRIFLKFIFVAKLKNYHLNISFINQTKRFSNYTFNKLSYSYFLFKLFFIYSFWIKQISLRLFELKMMSFKSKLNKSL